jgi:hypothetical protein
MSMHRVHAYVHTAAEKKKFAGKNARAKLAPPRRAIRDDRILIRGRGFWSQAFARERVRWRSLIKNRRLRRAAGGAFDIRDFDNVPIILRTGTRLGDFQALTGSRGLFDDRSEISISRGSSRERG